MSSLGLTFLRRFAVSALQRPPIVVRQTAAAGRGVFATRDIAQGEFIHSAGPIVAHPKLDYISKVCYYCLRSSDQQLMHPIRKQFADRPQANVHPSTALEVDDLSGIGSCGEARLFCSASCASSAENFFMIESRGDWSELHHYCRKNSLKFPLVARRLACMVIAGSASPDALDILAYPHYRMAQLFREERALLVRTLKRAGVQPSVLEFLSEDWYGGVIARLHINAFAVEMIDTASYGDLFDAAASSISGEGSVGTAVYILPSMYNHDCGALADPNVHVQWPENSSVRLEARQVIKEGEELRITYVDASLGYHARQGILSDAYGFLCECPRCRDRD